MTDAERCICCGEIIPEGRQVCIKCENAIKNKDMPMGDAVTHGHWIFEHHERDTGYLFIRIVCSNCGLKTGEKSNYCPQCGAKMDE